MPWGVAAEHVRARIGVSTGFRRVRSGALRLARAGWGARQGGDPNRREPNPDRQTPQGGTRPGGKSASRHDPSGSIASADVCSSARSVTWATAQRVPGTAGWPDGHVIPRKNMIGGRPVGKVPLHESAVFPVARAPRDARSAPIPASAGEGAKGRTRRFVIQALAGQEFGTTAGRKPGSSEPRGPTGWICGRVADLRLRSLRGRHRACQSERCRECEVRWTTYRPGVRPTHGAMRGRKPMRVLGRLRQGASHAGEEPKDLKFRGQLRNLGSEEGVRRCGLRVHAPGAFFISGGRPGRFRERCSPGMKRARRVRTGLFLRRSKPGSASRQINNSQVSTPFRVGQTNSCAGAGTGAKP